jgi:hypothetical protein
MEYQKDNITEKFCNDCKIIHEIDDFVSYTVERKLANGNTIIYTRYNCKIVADIREIIKKQHMKEYSEKNKEKNKRRMKEYRVKNKEKIKAQRKEYHTKYYEKIKIK